jgi:hypothetical protein
MLSVPNWLALYGIKTVEYFLRDCVLVKEELLGLEQELLLSKEPGIGKESVGDWLMANGIALGKTYVNDIKRHFTDGVSIPVLNINSH